MCYNRWLRHLGKIDCMVNPPELSDLGNRLISQNPFKHLRKYSSDFHHLFAASEPGFEIVQLDSYDLQPSI